ncbi:TetR/AcrR family transcriptional regulator [Solirubrobacter taibaiensis]|nr:TetR/AcrR family transcriptional regulator [Solirubrobacter taibaiensis]
MSARPRPRRRFRDAGQTRERVLAAALVEFSSSGYRGGTLGAIAARAGVSQSGLLRHFPNKELLLAAVIERRNDEHRAEFLDAVQADPDLGFLTGLVGLMRRAARELELTRLNAVVMSEATSTQHPAHDWAVQRYGTVNALVTNALHNAQQQAVLRADFDPEEVAWTLLAVMDGLQLRHVLSSHSMRIEQAFASLAAQILDDLAADNDAARRKIAAWRARQVAASPFAGANETPQAPSTT